MHKQPAPRADLRERVLRASVELIDEQGLEALSMREVARRANVSHQAPYHHFPDRAAILAAICERGFELLTQRLQRAREGSKGAFDEIERASVAYITFACEESAYFRVMFRPELVHQERYPNVVNTADSAFAHVPQMLAACVHEGLRVDPNEEAMVIALWSMVHGCACLLIDGPVEAKMPSALGERSRVIADVARAFRSLMEGAAKANAASAKAAKKKPVRSHRVKTTQ
jgi:AcrR family transcriptional regulator